MQCGRKEPANRLTVLVRPLERWPLRPPTGGMVGRARSIGACASSAEESALNALRNHSQFDVVDLGRGWKADLIVRNGLSFSNACWPNGADVAPEC